MMSVSVSQLYVFGGKNEEQDFNDLKVMKLINPSERQPGTVQLSRKSRESSGQNRTHFMLPRTQKDTFCFLTFTVAQRLLEFDSFVINPVNIRIEPNERWNQNKHGDRPSRTNMGS